MSSPIQEQPARAAVPVVPKRDWCCGTPVTGPHIAGCPYEPQPDDGVMNDVLNAAETQKPPPAPSGEPAAASSAPRPYGISRPREFDIDLPNGDRVRARKLTMTQAFELGIIDMMNFFGKELMKDVDPDADQMTEAELLQKVLLDPELRPKMFGPVDTVLAAAVIMPKIVLAEPSSDTQMNVNEIDLAIKLAIYNQVVPDDLQNAAMEAQREALKSVRPESEAVLRDLPAGEDVQPEAE